ncbi:hypothetical protein EYF80_022300 [Liparis tanakae]|uniref:Uncharacterized protein n=1 Tax=Liparis tanakae TaxID=230148 RepID=A0A4Z2HR73_9TELE|nr:hypothetical protein EYF80_022300 [Liparis tanakae]
MAEARPRGTLHMAAGYRRGNNTHIGIGRFTAAEVAQACNRLYFGDRSDDRCFMAGRHDDAPPLERIGEICRDRRKGFKHESQPSDLPAIPSSF